MENKRALIPKEMIERSILFLRGRKVMLDRDLSALYRVTTKALNQAVKRHRERFPSDFMFQLTRAETENWRSQIVTSNREKMGIRRSPYAFTENGVAMLSSVLNSRRAILVNIEIMRAFTQLHEMLRSHKKIWEKIERMEKKYDSRFKIVFDALRELLAPPKPAAPEKPKGPIGFQP